MSSAGQTLSGLTPVNTFTKAVISLLRTNPSRLQSPPHSHTPEPFSMMHASRPFRHSAGPAVGPEHCRFALQMPARQCMSPGQTVPTKQKMTGVGVAVGVVVKVGVNVSEGVGV
jgi:hypothetical protein